MKAQAIDKKFFKFVLPSMFTMSLNGLYTIVDGFFVGHAVGDVGLAGIGLVWPITAVLIALGMGIGVGGSVLMSTARGAGCDENANAARANTLMLLAAASALLTLLLVVMNPALVYALGARGEVYDAAMAYIRIISIGGSMQILASGLIPMIRNSHKTIQAMMIMGTGLVCNIILDACFTMIIPMGLAGAALATITAQSLTVAGSLACLFKDRSHPVRRSHFRLQKRMMARMLKIGVSPFGLSLMPSVITIYNNLQCLAYGGDLAVSAYAVINYFIGSVLLLLEGVGEGMQPLISYASGAGDYGAMKRLKNKGLMTVLVFSALFLIACVPAVDLLPGFFGTSAQTAEIIRSALPILGLAFPMMGLGKLFTSYFYACGETLYSTLLVYLDPVLFTPLCIFILSRLFGLKGVWMALPGAQALIMAVLVVLWGLHRSTLRSREAEYAG